MSPGATTFTRTPFGPSSSASDFTKASSPDFAVLCAQNPSPGCRDSPLLIAITDPLRRSTIPGTNALQQKKADLSSPVSFASNSGHGN